MVPLAPLYDTPFSYHYVRSPNGQTWKTTKSELRRADGGLMQRCS